MIPGPFPFLRSFLRILAIVVIASIIPVHSLFGSPEDDSRIINREGVLKARQGDLEGALKAFEAACKANPFDENALANLSCAHNNLGVFLVKNNRFSDAVRHFDAAKAQKPEDIEIRFNLVSTLVALKESDRVKRECEGIIALRPKDPETLYRVSNAFQKIEEDELASTVLERIVQIDPRHPRAFHQLGRLAYKKGNFVEARYSLDRAVENDPGYVPPADLLQRLNREENVESAFEHEESVHFAITFQPNYSRDLIREILDIFENAFQKTGDLLGCFPAQRAQVILYPRPAFEQVSDQPQWAGGMYDGKIRLPVPLELENAERLTGAIFHEYTHHLIFLLTDGTCPTWLNEGLAQVMEGLSLKKARDVLTNREGGNHLAPLMKLDGPFSRCHSRELAERMYSQALLTVSWIIEEKGYPAIQAILANLGRRLSPAESVAQGTGESVSAIESHVRETLEN